MQRVKDLINIDSEILGGQSVFKGTRVPVESHFMHLKEGISLDEFLDDFPSVSKAQAMGVLEIAGKIMSSRNIAEIYEAS